ncbi:MULTISPECIES: DUF4224 domain-containing protein [Bordetella]|uniref:DUF4224 domain-containing protein n=1 Tax=Bordetella genomosp. 2 TaxID=1983456 RepID=A0A261W0I2_9BORD|nr:MULTISPECIES: DUF4224 domain-containing protein [Bordetella]OZI79876.1 hypothetical protein CAL24_08160 [Bordetella genomosp. 2]
MLTLSPDELAEITGKTRKTSQVEILRELGIPFKIRPNGTPVVLRSAMEVALGYATKNEKPRSPTLRIPQARRLLSGQTG